MSGKRKTLRLLFAIVTIFQSGWIAVVGANVWCYRTGIPGSDIIFPHDVSPQKCKKKENKKYVAQLDCQQQNGHEKLKTHQCLLYALCFCSSSVCGQFIGLAIVPLEKMPDLKAAPWITPETVSLWCYYIAHRLRELGGLIWDQRCVRAQWQWRGFEGRPKRRPTGLTLQNALQG